MSLQEYRFTMEGQKVTYKIVDGFPAYRVGDDGSLWTKHAKGGFGKRFLDEWRQIKDRIDSWGYVVNKLSWDGSTRIVSRHVLVLEVFVGPRPVGMQARHANDIGHDNRLCNLSWGTPSQNYYDKIKNGGSGSGKLSFEIAAIIRQQYQDGNSQKALAKRFRVREEAIQKIIAGRTWNDGTYKKPAVGGRGKGDHHTLAKLTRKTVQEIKRIYAGGLLSQRKLALAFGVSESTIWAVIHGKNWKEDSET